MPITNCLHCGALFQAGEEYGNAPDRLCTKCWGRGVRLDCFGNRLRDAAVEQVKEIAQQMSARDDNR